MRVLQLIDSLDAGGAERVAVTYANTLSTQVEKSFLCTTRKEGLLKQTITDKVEYLFLDKKKALDFKAIIKLVGFIKKNKINIIHAHTSSYFLATIIKLIVSNISVIWHDHYGKSEEIDKRKFTVLKWCSFRFSTIISVNKKLERWAKKELKTTNVYYLENAVSLPQENNETPLQLHGINNKRIVCLANMRAQKDHENLLNAFELVIKKHPDYSLHLLGKHWDDDYFKKISSIINQDIFKEKVYYYGSQTAIFNILKQCDIGVLSSSSEGLPLALLEYGLTKLGIVCTNVGQCKDLVLSNGKCVQPGDPKELAAAINYYIKHNDKLSKDAEAFQNHINKNYSIKTIMPKLVSYYEACI